MKKIALPLSNNQVSQNFELCSAFFIITVDDENNIKKELVNAHLQPGILPYWLAEKGVTDIITKGIQVQTASQFNTFKINVFAGVEPSDPEQLVEEFLDGSLETHVIAEKN